MHRPNHDIWGGSSGDAPYGSPLTTRANTPLSSSAPAYAASSPGGTALPYDAASLALLTLFDSHHSHSPSLRHWITHHHPYQFRCDSLDASASVSASVSCVRLGLGVTRSVRARCPRSCPTTPPRAVLPRETCLGDPHRAKVTPFTWPPAESRQAFGSAEPKPYRTRRAVRPPRAGSSEDTAQGPHLRPRAAPRRRRRWGRPSAHAGRVPRDAPVNAPSKSQHTTRMCTCTSAPWLRSCATSPRATRSRLVIVRPAHG